MTDYCIVMAAYTDYRKAGVAIEEAFDKHLCASAQAFGCHSHYVWEGQMRKDDDVIVYFVAKKADFDELEKLLTKSTTMADYGQVLSVDIDQAGEKYLQWVEKMTTPKKPH